MKCSLCGLDYSEEEALKACANCPIKRCTMLRCPNCGFETPMPPKWLQMFIEKGRNMKSMIKQKTAIPNFLKSKTIDAAPLILLRNEQWGKVVYLDTDQPQHLQKLVAIGILPGATIQLIRKFPSYVFQLGQSQFAVDRELACCIYVEPL
jgi:Fe2+ transport system protein FeoA/rubredoxin